MDGDGVSYSRAREGQRGRKGEQQCRNRMPTVVDRLSVRAWQTRDGAPGVTSGQESGTAAGKWLSEKVRGTGTCHSRDKAKRQTSHRWDGRRQLSSLLPARSPCSLHHSITSIPFLCRQQHPHLSLPSSHSMKHLLPQLHLVSSCSPEITPTGIGEALPFWIWKRTLKDQNGDGRGAAILRSVLPRSDRACRGCIRGFESLLNQIGNLHC